jgi:hypothetical protein
VVDQNVFTLPHSDLNDFLFAVIGQEASGLELSVMSALAREGLDPWQEGMRLARLPLPSAIDELARMIAAMPASLWPQPVATEVATRLVRLLPWQDGKPSAVMQTIAAARLFGGPQTASPGINREWLTLILLGLAILVGSAVGIARTAPDNRVGAPAAPMASPNPAQPPAPPGDD